MISLADVERARTDVEPFVRRTALERNATLSKQLGTNVYLKLELFQRTGSFKPRGAFNQILQLSPGQREGGVVGVSGGNFAQAMALAAHELHTSAVVCMPESTPRNYVEATESYGAKVDFSRDITQVFESAERLRREGMHFLHPFDDPYQMAGAGGIGLEILEDLPDVTDVFVSIGGGGLYTGIAVAIESLRPDVRVWGIETELSDTMGRALLAGEVVQIVPQSLAKTLGSPYIAEDALAVMQAHPELYVAVSDREAFDEAVFLLERAKLNTELAAACTLAAARKLAHRFTEDQHVVLLVCGGNTSLDNWIEYNTILGG